MGEGVKTRRGTSKGSVVPDGNLYSLGDEKTSITGGWGVGYLTQQGSQSKQVDHLYIEATANIVNYSNRTYVTTNKIDVTSVNKLYMQYEVNMAGFGDAGVNFRISSNSDGISSAVAYSYQNTQNGLLVMELNVSAVTGSYYIGCNLQAGINSGTMKIYKVWSE